MVDKINLNKLLSMLTVGYSSTNKPFEDLSLFPSDFSVKKSEILSIFSSEEEKKAAEQIFNYFNLNENKIDGEDIFDLSEITNIAEELAYSADLDGDIYNISEEEITKYFAQKGITVTPKTVMRLLNKIGTMRDYSKNIRNGVFKIGSEKHDCTVTTDTTDSTGRTYILTDKETNQKYKAVMGGQDAALQILTDDFYSRFLSGTKTQIKRVISPNEVIGIVLPDNPVQYSDTTEKKALDVFLGNTGSPAKGAFGTDLRNNKKSFTSVLTELKEQAKNTTIDDIVKILETISDYNETEIKNLLKKYNYDKQYADILTERIHFAKEMLSHVSEIKQTNKMTASDFTEKLEAITLKHLISEATEEKVLLDYQKAIDELSNLKTKEALQKLLNDKRETFDYNQHLVDSKAISEDDIETALTKYGYVKTNVLKDFGPLYAKRFTDDELNILKKKYGDNADAVKEILEMPILVSDIIKTIRQRASIGYDVLANRENFDTFILTSIMMNDLQGNYEYESGQYDLLQESAKNWPNKSETGAIDFYKSEEYWKINNALTELKLEDTEPSPKISKMITQLTKLIDKTKAPKSFSAYRGEGYEIFNSIKLSSGITLGNAMEEIALNIQKEGATDLNKSKINKLIEEVQNSNFTATQERFMSTSMTEETALGFGKTELIIEAPAGSKAISIDAVNVLGNFTVEEEILFQRGSKLTITDLEYNYDTNKWVIYAIVETN